MFPLWLSSSSFRSPSHLHVTVSRTFHLVSSSAAPPGIPTASAEPSPPQSMLSISAGQGVGSPGGCGSLSVQLNYTGSGSRGWERSSASDYENRSMSELCKGPKSTVNHMFFSHRHSAMRFCGVILSSSCCDVIWSGQECRLARSAVWQ